MSEFFNLTLNNTVIIDDSTIKKNTTWSSHKILNEIVDKRLTKLEQLEDVDVINRKDKQILSYSQSTGKFTTVTIGDIGEAGGMKIHQLTKLGLQASQEKPHVINIPINTVDFKVPRVNVLQYMIGDENVLVTKNAFSNNESSDFIEDDFIKFDDKASLNLNNIYTFQSLEDDEEYNYYSTKINLNNFKHIDSFDDFEDGVIKKLTVCAIPKDRLLRPTKDLNLTNANNIDYFKLTALGKNLKCIVSIDSGCTWKTFKNQKWQTIKCTTEDISKNGIDINTFNNINSIFWNELITNKKIRFCYFFCMDNMRDVEEIDKLELQYDGIGKWKQVKESEYDVIYASNTILEVHLRIGGDIKINY